MVKKELILTLKRLLLDTLPVFGRRCRLRSRPWARIILSRRCCVWKMRRSLGEWDKGSELCRADR